MVSKHERAHWRSWYSILPFSCDRLPLHSTLHGQMWHKAAGVRWLQPLSMRQGLIKLFR